MYGESAADVAPLLAAPRTGREFEPCSPVMSSDGALSSAEGSGRFHAPSEEEGVETHSSERWLSTVRDSTGDGTVVTGAAVHACVSMRNTCTPPCMTLLENFAADAI